LYIESHIISSDYNFEASFSTVVVNTQEMVTGYIDGVVVLTCEVYGYLRSNNLTVEWLRETGGTRQPLQNTPKYTIEYSNRSHLIQNPNGTTTARQSTVANLTIHELATADAGRYICETGWEEEAATTLTVTNGSRPTAETLVTGETPVTRVTEVTTTMPAGSTG